MISFQSLAKFLKRDISLTNKKAWNPSLWNLAGSQSLSGEIVTESTALTYSAVYSAVSLISGTIAALPLHLMQRKGDRKILADGNPLYWVMNDHANDYMTAMAFRETMMAHILLWGNCYAEKITNGTGDITALWPIPPDRVALVSDGEGGVKYRVRLPDRSDIIMGRDRILHVAGLGYDGYQGYSVIAMARKSIGLGMALETFGSLYFSNGTHPGIIVSHPGQLSAAANNNLKTSLAETHSGLGKSHRLMLLEEGMKIENISIAPNDSQFLESRQFQIPEIARWFNLPPHKLKDLTKSSFSNIESEQISFVRDSILPWLIRFEQNYNLQLLSKSDKSLSGNGRLYFKHAVEGLLRGDSTARGAFYKQMFDIGAFSVNEIRAFEDMDPVEGGDIHLVPMNYQNLKFAGEKPEPAPVKEIGEVDDGTGGTDTKEQADKVSD